MGIAEFILSPSTPLRIDSAEGLNLSYGLRLTNPNFTAASGRAQHAAPLRINPELPEVGAAVEKFLDPLLPAALPAGEAAALFFAGGDDAAPFFFVVEEFFFVIGHVGGDLEAVVVRVEKINAALAFGP